MKPELKAAIAKAAAKAAKKKASITAPPPKKKPGPKGPDRSKPLEIAPTQKSAAAAWGIPLATIQLAKASGCPAFETNRVHRQPLLDWLAQHPEVANPPAVAGDTAELKRQKLANEVELSRLKIERERGEIIPRDEAKAEWARAIGIIEDEAKSLMEPDHYRIFCERCKARIKEGVES